MRKDLKNIEKSKVFKEFIYPCFAREFLIECRSYEEFVTIISNYFILTPAQWECVLTEWEDKEMILTY